MLPYLEWMTGIKAQQLSLDEWRELLEPYGWAHITVRSPLMPLGGKPPFVEYDIRVILKPSPGGELGEWAQRSFLLESARQAVEVARGRGYILMTAPRIELGGDYKYRVDQGTVPDWIAEAEVSFRVHAT